MSDQTPYTPSLGEVRDAYAKRRALYLAQSGHVLANDAKYDREDYAEFDRLIAQVRAEAWDEGQWAESEAQFRDAGYGNVQHPVNPYREGQ